MEEETSPKIPVIDRIANGEQFLMFKAALPYLDLPLQRTLAVYIKFMEMQNILRFYEHSEDMSISSVSSSEGSMLEMLQEMSYYCNPAMKGQFEQVMQTFQMLNMFQSMQSMDSPEDLLGSMLSPEQQELFHTYQSMIPT